MPQRFYTVCCEEILAADRYRKPVPVCTGSASLLQPVPVCTGRYRPWRFHAVCWEEILATDRYRRPGTGLYRLRELFGSGTDPYRPVEARYWRFYTVCFQEIFRGGGGRYRRPGTGLYRLRVLFGSGTDPYRPVQARYRRERQMRAFGYLPTITYDRASGEMHDHICSYNGSP
jgi:hypothetical protein